MNAKMTEQNARANKKTKELKAAATISNLQCISKANTGIFERKKCNNNKKQQLYQKLSLKLLYKVREKSVF